MRHLLQMLAASCALVASLACGQPAEIIIIRHGEKPDHGDDLSLKGEERAAVLVPFFKDSDNGTPIAIYAQGPSDKRSSRRPVETVTPLARELKLAVQTFHHSDYAGMIKEILHKRDYNGKIVLICWEHKGIPDVARELGVSDPPDWKGHAFDRLWIITFKDGRARMQDAPQRLLFGDSAE